MTTVQVHVIGGIDTHKDFHHASLITVTGRLLTDRRFPATGAGYRQLLAWMRSFGIVDAVGVEGTGSYGAALSRMLTAAGVAVVEVNRPSSTARRRDGKSDQLDSEQAARAVLAQTATATPKTRTGMVEAIRLLRTTRASAVRARTQAMNALHAAVIVAPEALREQLITLHGKTLINRCARLRPETTKLIELADDPDRLLLAAAKTALRDLATRWLALDDQINALSRQLAALVASAAPQLLALHGVGTEIAGQLLITAGDNPERLTSEAAFAKLCGAAPQPATSGKITSRHRLTRGGDRAANSALYLIAITRMSRHEPTRTYVARRTAEGKSKREIIRCLKRYIVREVFTALPPPTPAQTIPTAA